MQYAVKCETIRVWKLHRNEGKMPDYEIRFTGHITVTASSEEEAINECDATLQEVLSEWSIESIA